MNDDLDLIRNRRRDIAKEKRALDAEDASLAQAEETIVRVRAKIGPHGGNGADSSPTTHRQYVIATMRKSEHDWFDSGEALRQEVIRLFGKDIKRTTFQPLVSGMTTEPPQVLRRNDDGQIGLIERVGPG
jgi:hypothetical protein